MQRNPRSTRQECTARITASNLFLSLYKRRRFFSFTSAILSSWLQHSSQVPERSGEELPAQPPKARENLSCYMNMNSLLLRVVQLFLFSFANLKLSILVHHQLISLNTLYYLNATNCRGSGKAEVSL